MMQAMQEVISVSCISKSQLYFKKCKNQSVYYALQAAGAPIDFETFFLSDIQYSLSAKIDDVVKSVQRNGICLKGVLASPVTGDLTSLNYQLR